MTYSSASAATLWVFLQTTWSAGTSQLPFDEPSAWLTAECRDDWDSYVRAMSFFVEREKVS